MSHNRAVASRGPVETDASDVRLLLSLDADRRHSPTPPEFPRRLPRSAAGGPGLIVPLTSRDGETVGLLQLFGGGGEQSARRED